MSENKQEKPLKPKNLSREYYIYIHYRLDTNVPFYVGKGKNKRAWNKRKRNPYWNNIVNKYGYRVEIKAQDLLEQEAFELEKQTIEELSNIYSLANMTVGGEGCTHLVTPEKQQKEILRLSDLIWVKEVERTLLSLEHLLMAAEGLQKLHIIENIKEFKEALNG